MRRATHPRHAELDSASRAIITNGCVWPLWTPGQGFAGDGIGIPLKGNMV